MLEGAGDHIRLAAAPGIWHRIVTAKLLDALDDSAVWHFLAHRGDNAHLIVPRAVLARVLQRNGEPRFSYTTDLTAPIPESQNLFVWDLERSDLAKAKLSFPTRRVFGILRDVWAADAAGADVFADPAAGPGPTVHYAVVCGPRSGSTFLCDLLTEGGLGQPREHIRPGFIELYNAGYRFDELMGWIIERGTRGGFFGTKLLSVLVPSFDTAGAGRNALEEFFRAKDFRIILLSRDPIEQAVSGYFASRTGLWHVRPGQVFDAAQPTVPYNWKELYREYIGFCTGHELLADFARRFPAALQIDYGDLDRDPHATLARVAGFLGAPESDAWRPDLAGMLQKISRSHDRMQRYLARFRADLAAHGIIAAGGDPEEIPTATAVKVLRLERGDGGIVAMTVEEDGVVIERQATAKAYEAVALLANEYEFDTVLDIGGGDRAAARIFRALDKEVLILDATYNPAFPPDIRADFLDVALTDPFDLLFCSHVLEQQRNIGAFTDRLFDVLPEGGILALTTSPICSHRVAPSHCNPLNAGMLLYHLVMSGFDCREARVLTYGNNTTVVVRRKATGLVRRSSAMASDFTAFLPAAIKVGAEQFNGAIRAIDWVPVLDTRPDPGAGITAPDGPVPTARQLQLLVDDGRPDEALRLLDGVSLDPSRGADFDYYAGVALGTTGRLGRAIGLLKRAATAGFAPFWCAYHLGLFEMRRGAAVPAAGYLTAAAILKPERNEVWSLLQQVARGIDLDLLRRLQSGSRTAADAPAAFDRGLAMQQAGKLGAAAFYFTLSAALDPVDERAKLKLIDLRIDLPTELLGPDAPAARP